MGDGSEAIRAYWRLLLKWWWILSLGTVSAAVAAFFVSGAMTPAYVSGVKVLVQGGQAPTLLSVGDVQASRDLAETFVELVKTRPILEEVIETLSLPIDAVRLKGMIQVGAFRSIIEIEVRHSNPQQAALIANAVADTFISDLVTRQFSQIAKFQSSLSQYGIINDPNIIASQAATLGALSIAESAIPPIAPASPRTRLNVVVAGILGLLVAGLLVLVLERLDDTIKTAEDLRNIPDVKSMGSSLDGLVELGSVAKISLKGGFTNLATTLISGTNDNENSHRQLAEAYKYLSLNLEFAGLANNQLKTILITSAFPQEGKTTTAANIAISMSRSGKSVILVDTDLRRPTLHNIFDLDGPGLTNFLTGRASIDEILQKIPIENLRVVPSGPVPPDATVILQSGQMRRAVELLSERADIVIYDSPPVLSAADAVALGDLIDGVVIVVSAGSTRRAMLRLTVQRLKQSNLSILGAVLNKIPQSFGDYGYYQQYNYSYVEKEVGPKQQKAPIRLILNTFSKISSKFHKL